MPQGNPLRVPDDGLTTGARRNAPVLAMHTGDGKGKPTAAFGMALRAWNAGLDVAAFQFVKSHRTATTFTDSYRQAWMYRGGAGSSGEFRYKRRSAPGGPAWRPRWQSSRGLTVPTCCTRPGGRVGSRHGV